MAELALDAADGLFGVRHFVEGTPRSELHVDEHLRDALHDVAGKLGQRPLLTHREIDEVRYINFFCNYFVQIKNNNIYLQPLYGESS